MEIELLRVLTRKESKKVNIVSFKKGTTIYKENDLCENLAIVVQGKVEIVSFHFEQKKLTYNIINAGQIFANNLIFTTSPYFKGDVVCLEKVTLALIDKKSLIEILQNNEKFLLIYLSIQSKSSLKLNERIRILSFENLKDRLLFYINENGGEIEYKSISSLADFLRCERETLSRLITSLCNNKIIKKEEKKLKII